MAKRFTDIGIEPGDLESPQAARAKNRRLASAGRALGSARECLAAFDRGTHLFAVNKGQFSMIDILQALLERTGAADVSVWSWVVAGHEVEATSALINAGAIRSFRIVIDWTGAQRDMVYVRELQQRYGLDCVRVTKTHCKVLTIATDDGWRIVARGSMNLNANPRMEQFDVSDDAAIYDVMRGLEDELWRRGKPRPVSELVHNDAAALFNAEGEGWSGVGMGALPDWAKPDKGDGGGWF